MAGQTNKHIDQQLLHHREYKRRSKNALVWGQLTPTNHPHHLNPFLGRGILGGWQRLDGHRRRDGPMIYSNRD